jgi:hypothetical protein
VALSLAGSIATLLGLLGGWLLHRQRYRREVDKMRALYKRQVGVSAERLEEARKLSDVLKQEVLLLKKEIVQQQARWLRASPLGSASVASVQLRRVAEPPPQEPYDDGSGFANTQPWEHGSP